jgi:hypothetical protein
VKAVDVLIGTVQAIEFKPFKHSTLADIGKAGFIRTICARSHMGHRLAMDLPLRQYQE